MLVWILLIVGLLSLILPEVLHQVGNYIDRDSWPYVVSEIVGVCCVVAFIAYSLSMYCVYISKEAELKAFYNSNNTNYSIVVDKTDDILTLSSDAYVEVLVDGSIEKMEVGNAEATRLAEWRDACVAYNKEREIMLALNNSIWFGNLVPDVSDLPEIRIQ